MLCFVGQLDRLLEVRELLDRLGERDQRVALGLLRVVELALAERGARELWGLDLSSVQIAFAQETLTFGIFFSLAVYGDVFRRRLLG